MDQSSNCFDIVNSGHEGLHRCTRAGTYIRGLQEYRSLLSQLATIQEKEACRRVRPLITERAYRAEIMGRALIAETLDAVNVHRDASSWYERVGNGLSALAGMGKEGLEKVLTGAAQGIDKAFGFDSQNFIDEGIAALRTLELRLTPAERGTILSYNSPMGGSITRTLSATPQLGQRGRVGVAEFFGAHGSPGYQVSGPLWVQPDCHSRTIAIDSLVKQPVDLYAGVLAGLATMKGQMYQHARRVEELGPRALRGNDPVSAVLVVIAVVGAGLLIYGLATGNYDVAAFGAILLIGCALVAFAGFTLVFVILA